jgi:hypothetical protein
MARASRESLDQAGIFPIPWFTPHLAKNHEERENASPLAAENAKLMARGSLMKIAYIRDTICGA